MEILKALIEHFIQQINVKILNNIKGWKWCEPKCTLVTIDGSRILYNTLKE